ncbi:hypothetical protein XACJK48_7590010 [Xanthomonas citri pv. citri]|nr:hypothetical protein XACS584_1230070 [Xanthomonas citri pv. citri]CEF21498.1 hypothetical protein XACJK2_1460015 [Xanthomonas citri pv. citri]CEH52786.1 hypothetical protein XACS582_11160007 [Xanthomonas citri pv. citri]CEH54191.1 hypothetical protein XACJK48_7590010 [Xanthomonas citri pv. citri]CEH93827.1 hypothetical protein XACS581_1970028 [Xanthomonas citri pv. citri]
MKRHHALNALTHGEVAPSRARGLKHVENDGLDVIVCVAPSRARGLKLDHMFSLWEEGTSRPHGRVD